MGWLLEILWNLWAGLSTVGSVLFLLLAGLALFGIFAGIPYLLRLRRQRSAAARAMAAVPPAVRDMVFACSRALGGFPPPEAILAAAPELRAPLSGLGITPEELIDRLLAEDAPIDEEPAGESDLQ